MPPDYQATEWGALRVFLDDPILLAGSLLPFLLLAGLLFIRVRAARRFSALTKRNDEAFAQNAARWQESAERSDKMIALLSEIRDHMARLAPLAPDAEARDTTTGAFERRE